MKTIELEGAALDWAVTMIEKPEACKYGVEDWLEQRRRTVKNGEYVYRWHKAWAQGGPIIEREGISVWEACDEADPQEWLAITNRRTWGEDGERDASYGPTPLIAAMRCYVASKLGDEVEVPDGL